MPPPGWRDAGVGLLYRRGVLYLGWFPPTMARADGRTQGSGLAAVLKGTSRLLDGGEFH